MLSLLESSALTAHTVEGGDWDTLASKNEIRTFDGTGEEIDDDSDVLEPGLEDCVPGDAVCH